MVVSLPLMLEVIEKLLILQDRDRKIRRLQTELAHIEPERQSLKTKTAGASSDLEAGKQRVNQVESERKRLELEIEARQAQVTRYANQQLETRKNEEYQALAQQIQTCKGEITRLEDQVIDLMEQAEAAQKEVVRLRAVAVAAQQGADDLVAQLGEREKNLQKELEELQSARNQQAETVEAGVRARYERLLKTKGDNALAGVNHGVCGGCHMKLPTQVLVACQAEQEVVSCINCGRILYYTREMSLTAAE